MDRTPNDNDDETAHGGRFPDFIGGIRQALFGTKKETKTSKRALEEEEEDQVVVVASPVPGSVDEEEGEGASGSSSIQRRQRITRRDNSVYSYARREPPALARRENSVYSSSYTGEPPAKMLKKMMMTMKIRKASCVRTDQEKLFDCFQNKQFLPVDKIKDLLRTFGGAGGGGGLIDLMNAQELETGKTILSLACSNEQYLASAELIQFILCELLSQEEEDDKKEFVNLADRDGLTPLHHAAKAGNSSALDLCLRFGAIPNHKDRYGRTALHSACSGHYYYPDDKSSDNDGKVQVRMWAHRFKNRQLDCMDLLINADPTLLQEVDDEGRTPLFDCLRGVGGGISWDLTTFMIERGATLTTVDHQQQNLVHHVLKEVSCHINLMGNENKEKEEQEEQQPEDTTTTTTTNVCKKKQDDRWVVGGNSMIPPRVLFETQILFRLLINLEPQLLSQKDGGGGTGTAGGGGGLTPFMTVCFWGNLDLMFYFLKEHNAIQELL